MIRVAPSLLSADFARLAEEVRSVERAGADLLHVDVMDGHFVPNLTIGPVVVAALRRTTRLPLDVHLMIETPERYLQAFREAGSDHLTVHVEACGRRLERTLRAIRRLGASAGVSLKPATPLSAIVPVLPLVQMVLVMSVNPGFGGQAFMPEVLPKIAALRRHFRGAIEIDGGINDRTGAEAVAAGVDVLVAGTYIFKAKSRAAAIRSLRSAETARSSRSRRATR
jgi:ribulose-phosphate 3-epimerase